MLLSYSNQLPLLDVHVLTYHLHAQSILLHQGEMDTDLSQPALQLAQLVPLQMPAQPLVDLIHRPGLYSREQRADTRRPRHLNQDQMLTADDLQVLAEALSQD